jgi:hypothetical protein
MRKANLFLTDQLQVIQSRIRWLRSFQFIFLVSGLLLIWIAERSAGHQSRPFSNWYLAFVAYIFYGFLSVAFVRRRATRGFSRSKLPTKILVQRWLTAESLTLCIAYSPILCFLLSECSSRCRSFLAFPGMLWVLSYLPFGDLPCQKRFGIALVNNSVSI